MSLQDPVILDELDFLYKSDCARKITFFYQPDGTEEDLADLKELKSVKKTQRSITAMNLKDKQRTPGLLIKKLYNLYLIQGHSDFALKTRHQLP